LIIQIIKFLLQVKRLILQIIETIFHLLFIIYIRIRLLSDLHFIILLLLLLLFLLLLLISSDILLIIFGIIDSEWNWISFDLPLIIFFVVEVLLRLLIL
jgi:hypothetical protein